MTGEGLWQPYPLGSRTKMSGNSEEEVKQGAFCGEKYLSVSRYVPAGRISSVVHEHFISRNPEKVCQLFGNYSQLVTIQFIDKDSSFFKLEFLLLISIISERTESDGEGRIKKIKI